MSIRHIFYRMVVLVQLVEKSDKGYQKAGRPKLRSICRDRSALLALDFEDSAARRIWTTTMAMTALVMVSS